MSGPVRVCHVITRLIVGGAQENTLYTAIGQHRDERFDVTLACGVDRGREGNLFGQARAAELKLVLVSSLVRPIRPHADARALFDLFWLFRRGGYDVVHTHSSKAGILGRMAARLARVPVVVHTLHSLVFHRYQAEWRNRLYISLKRACASFTDILIGVNERTVHGALAERIGRPAQYITIYSGIDLEPFLSIPDRLSVPDAKRRVGIDPACPVVGKIARLVPLKGHDLFLETAARIAPRVPGARFLLVGDGTLRESLQDRAIRMGIGDRVVFAGLLPPQEIPAYIQAMDVVVHTSLREGIARVLPQAGAVGKPVVTHDLDGASEAVQHGISGYVVPPNDAEALAERVVELLVNQARRDEFGRAGREFARRNFSLEMMVRRINEVYLSQLASRSA
jgi:glycosyltransferase involved in cell wall biosynthesis